MPRRKKQQRTSDWVVVARLTLFYLVLFGAINALVHVLNDNAIPWFTIPVAAVVMAFLTAVGFAI